MAAMDVRPIRPDELVDWVETMHVAFHSNGSAPDEAAFRREVFDQDVRRTLAAEERTRIVGTYESFPSELSLPGACCVSANAVSAVSVLPTHRRRGLLGRLLELDHRLARERGDTVSILIAAEYPIYGRFGFGPAAERAEYRLDPKAARFARAAPGRVELVEPARMRELAPAVFDRFRRDWPGQIDREPPTRWDIRLGLRETPWRRSDQPLVRCATYTSPAGEVEGYLLYRVEERWERKLPRASLEVAELIALSAEAYLGLWRYCCEIDLLGEITAGMRRTDEPLSWLVDNPRAAVQQTLRTDFLWLRPLDTARLLAARRYASEQRLVLEVGDPLGLCGGRFALEGGPDGANCAPSDEAADLRLGMPALSALSLGGVSPRVLSEAGLIDEERPGALARAERLFRWPVTPWCSTFF